MKKMPMSNIDWLNLDEYDSSEDSIFSVTQNELDNVEEQIRLMEGRNAK